MKKIFLFLLIALCFSVHSHAVLKEKNLEQTISVLRSELKSYHDNMEKRMVRYKQRNDAQHKQMIQTIQKCNQLSLMIYSQRTDYTFDMTYACSEATTLYHQFTRGNSVPYETILNNLNVEILRYEGLISSLEAISPAVGNAKLQREKRMNAMPDSVKHKFAKRLEEMKKKGMTFPQLSKKSQKERDECIEYCNEILGMFKQMRTQMTYDKEDYERLNKKLKELNDYAEMRYQDLQNSIFKNGSNNYFKTLSRLDRVTRNIQEDFDNKYSFAANKEARSQWKGPIVIFLSIFVIIYLILSGIISSALILGIAGNVSRLENFYRKIMKKEKKEEESDNVFNKIKNYFKSEEFAQKKVCITLAVTFVLFAIAVMIVRNIMPSNNFMQMATSLLIEFAWLVGVILISLLIRLNGKLIRSGFMLYTPIILMGFIIISFRIIFIPNDIIELVFPPILLIFTIWQYVSMNRIRKKLELEDLKHSLSDQFYTWIALASMVISTIMSWCGYTLLAVQIFIWWLFQLTAIQTITCIYYILENYKRKYILHEVVLYLRIQKRKAAERKYKFELLQAQNNNRPEPKRPKELDEVVNDSNTTKKERNSAEEVMKNKSGEYVRITWFYDFIEQAFVPIISVISVLFCINWAAGVFNMQEICKNFFFFEFVHIEGKLQMSLARICLVIGMFFIFRYICYSLKAWWRYAKKKSQALKEEKGIMITTIGQNRPNYTLTDNATTIAVWGIYCIFVMKWFSISTSAISLITAGLATGVGFAMKDLLENFFYGMSLMAGRLHVGDYIECDGIRGKVESITYQSTQISTADGCTIAFLNSSLFTKNFKNLTKNHLYELVKVPVGVAYGANVEEVRQLLVKCIEQEIQKDNLGRDIISTAKNQTYGVIFNDFGDNSVNLYVTFWVLVEKKIAVCAKIKESIYNTLNANHIEIPFPQRDIYIRHVEPLPVTSANNQIFEKPSEN